MTEAEKVTNIDPVAGTVAEETGTSLALPSDVAGLVAMRKKPFAQGLNDQVDQIHVNIWGGEDGDEYRRYLDATTNSAAKEGSTIADDFEACRMIRNWAEVNGNAYIAGQNLTTLKTALGVVMRRYSMARKDRKDK